MKTERPKERESDILRTILEGLSALRIWHVRMNSGAMFGEYAGKKRMLRFGRRGMADILAIRHEYRNLIADDEWRLDVIWLEVKRPGGKMTADQVAFESEVLAEGHKYILAHSWDDVIEAFRLQ